MKKLMTTVLKFVVFFMGWALLAGLLPLPETENAALWRFFAELMPFLAIVVFSVLGWLMEKQQLTVVGTVRCRDVGIGLGAGMLWIGAAVIVLLAAGCMTIEGSQPVSALWLWLLALLLNTMMQELLVRGFLYRLIQRNYNTVAAAVVTSVLFLLCHGGALEAGWLPVANILSMSLFATALLEYTGSLAAPVLVHFIWNSIGGVVLGGVSLAEDYPHLIDIAMHGDPLLSGGVYMIEGSLVVLVLNLAFFAVFAFLARRRVSMGRMG